MRSTAKAMKRCRHTARVLVGVWVLSTALPAVSRAAQHPSPPADSVSLAHPAVAALIRQLSANPAMHDSAFVRLQMPPSAFERISATALTQQLEVMRKQSGGVRIVDSERRGDALRLRVAPSRAEGGAWLDVYTAGQHLLGWNIRVDHFARSGAPPALPDRTVPRDSVAPIINAWMDWWATHDRWSGTLGIARADQKLLIRAVGMADRERRIAATRDTRYHLGSSNKMLTAVVLLQLAQEGRLSLDDTMSTFLPDYPRPEIARRITIRHLLTHTSGLGGLFDLPRFEPKRRYGSNAAYLPLFADRNLSFDPGTRYSYSNEGFLLAGAIIERVVGMSFDAVLAQRIIGRAQMTGWCDCMGEPQATRRARGYSHREEQDPFGFGPLTDNEYFLFAEGIAAGGYYATAEDYLRFASAMRRGVLLDTAHQRAMYTRTAQSPDARGYGLGTELMAYGGKASWGHGGGGGRSGIGTQFATFVDGSWTVALMGNRDLYLTTEMLRPLMNFLAKQPPS